MVAIAIPPPRRHGLGTSDPAPIRALSSPARGHARTERPLAGRAVRPRRGATPTTNTLPGGPKGVPEEWVWAYLQPKGRLAPTYLPAPDYRGDTRDPLRLERWCRDRLPGRGRQASRSDLRHGYASHVDVNWESLALARFLRRVGDPPPPDHHRPARIRGSDRFSSNARTPTGWCSSKTFELQPARAPRRDRTSSADHVAWSSVAIAPARTGVHTSSTGSERYTSAWESASVSTSAICSPASGPS